MNQNLAVLQPKQKATVQPKLQVNLPGDRFEQEADAMADRVMRMPAYENNYKPKTGIIGASVQRKCASCDEEDKKKRPIMRKTISGSGGMQASDSLVSSLNATKGSGSPLPQGTMSFMGNAFSTDFSNVRLHTDNQASEMSKGINAKAFTYGNDIYFNSGNFSPETVEGKKLLAHELAHVVHQTKDITKTEPIVYRKKYKAVGEVIEAKGFLETAILNSEDTFKKLIDAPQEADARLKLVQSLNVVCVPAISQVRHLAFTFSSKELKDLIPLVDDLSNNLLLIKKWIDGRTGNAKLVEAFSEVFVETDIVREQIGLKEIGLGEAKGFPEREESEAIAEKGLMDGAKGDYTTQWNVLEKAMEEGIEQWYELAKIEEQQKPTFFESFLSSLLTAAIGNIAGILIKSFIEVAEEDVIKDAIREIVSGTTSDTTQTILGPVLAAAESGSGSSAKIKALLYLRSGLKAICREQELQSVKELNQKVSEGEYSIDKVRQLEKTVRESEKKAVERLKFQSATDWVRYVVQSNLIASRKANKEAGIDKIISDTTGSISNKKTDLHGYFGQKEHTAAGVFDKFGEGSHEGISGILKISVKIEEGSIQSVGINLYNLNKEMAELILSGEDVKTLDDVKVPKEVHLEIWEKRKITEGSGISIYIAKLAIDETGIIIDYIPPQQMEELKWQMYLATWLTIRKTPVSNLIVE